jgi:predicted  nucleic acid-binding Zn-ribbon protein
MSNSTSTEQVIQASFKVIQGDLEDMKASMSKMADALSKIAVLEERHQTMSATMLRVMEKLEKIAERQSSLELEHVKQATTVKVTVKAIQVVWGVIGAGVLYGAWQLIKIAAAQG